MPVIPSTRGQQVREQAFRSSGFNVRPSEPVGQIKELQAASQVVNQVVDIANKERAKADDIEFNKYSERLRRERLKQSQAYKQTKQEDALRGLDPALEGFQRTTQDILGEVQNERVKQRLSQYREKLSTDFDYDANGHAITEKEKYDDAVTMSSLDSIQSVAVEEYSAFSPTAGTSRLEESLAEQRQKIDAYADRKGMSAEEKSQLLQRASSQLHYKVVSKMLAEGKDLLAKDYYESIKGRSLAKDVTELNADTQIKLDKLINTGSIRGEAQRTTAQILNMNLGLTDSLAQVDAMIESGADPELIDETRRRVRQRWQEQDTVKRYQREQTNLAALDTIADMGLDAVPVEVLTNLTSAESKEIKKYAGLKARGAAPITDPVTKYGLERMASDPRQRQKFLDTNLIQYVNKLSPSDFNEMRRLKENLRTGQAQKDPKLKQIQSNIQVITGVAETLGITNKKDRESFEAEVSEYANQWQELNGKAIPNDELQRIANRLGMEVDPAGIQWGNKRIFELEPGEGIEEIKYDNIPRQYRFEIQEMLKREGRAYTKENVEAKMREILRQPVVR